MIDHAEDRLGLLKARTLPDALSIIVIINMLLKLSSQPFDIRPKKAPPVRLNEYIESTCNLPLAELQSAIPPAQDLNAILEFKIQL
jgi:hypothetical protein